MSEDGKTKPSRLGRGLSALIGEVEAVSPPESKSDDNGKGGAAEILNINPNTLRSRMKKLHIKRPEEQI